MNSGFPALISKLHENRLVLFSAVFSAIYTILGIMYMLNKYLLNEYTTSSNQENDLASQHQLEPRVSCLEKPFGREFFMQHLAFAKCKSPLCLPEKSWEKSF